MAAEPTQSFAPPPPEPAPAPANKLADRSEVKNINEEDLLIKQQKLLNALLEIPQEQENYLSFL